MFKVKHVLPLALLGALMALAPMGAANAASRSMDGNLVLTSPMLQGAEPVTLYGANTSLISTFDPQRAEDELSINAIQNLFLGLTDFDPKDPGNIRPTLATKWTTNDAGDVWTFTIRNDVPWVRWDPKAHKATVLRMVTAKDIEYGMKRSCDPRLGAYYTGAVSAVVLKGCDVVAGIAPDKIKDTDFDQVAVKALSDTQLEVTTQGPLPYFLSTSGMWQFRPVYKEAIDEFGDKWTDPGNIVTNGPFVIDEYDKTVTRVYVRNPNYVEVNDSYGGNVERIRTIIVKDGGTIYNLYQAGQVDASGIPAAELSRLRNDPQLSKEIYQVSNLAVDYFGFAYDKPPFDNVHARRAFSAAFDRNAYVSEVLQGRGVPMAHFMPPGIRGAVPINEVGLGTADNFGFDPTYAKKEIAAAGYPNCANFPTIRILAQEGAQDTVQFLQNAVKTNLGCDTTKINVESAEFSVFLTQIKKENPTAQRPNMWTSAWGPDYPDAQDWMYAVLSCKSANDDNRKCADIDKSIDAAGKEQDPQKRDQMYRDLETAMFATDGEFPILVTDLQLVIGLHKPWYKSYFDTDGLFGGAHWNSYQIDQKAQLAARGGANVPLATPAPKPTAVPTKAQ